MSLSFLQVDTAAGTARSPVATAAAAAGGHLELRDGWLVATSFGDLESERGAAQATVAVGDASSLGKVDVYGAHDRPLGSVATEAGITWCPITPARQLALGSGAVAAQVLGAAPNAVDVTAVYAALVIAGPLARETIARFCALDLRDQTTPVGGFRPGSVARTPGFVVRESGDRFLLLFGAAYAQYLWGVAVDAAEHLGGRPVGTDALQGVLSDA